jgi:hypothetical protein
MQACRNLRAGKYIHRSDEGGLAQPLLSLSRQCDSRRIGDLPARPAQSELAIDSWPLGVVTRTKAGSPGMFGEPSAM